MGWKESYMYIYIYKTNFARYIYIYKSFLSTEICVSIRNNQVFSCVYIYIYIYICTYCIYIYTYVRISQSKFLQEVLKLQATILKIDMYIYIYI